MEDWRPEECEGSVSHARGGQDQMWQKDWDHDPSISDDTKGGASACTSIAKLKEEIQKATNAAQGQGGTEMQG